MGCLKIASALLAMFVAWLMSPSLAAQGMRRVGWAFIGFYGSNFLKFEQEHRELYSQAVSDGNYSEVTMHYYSLQAQVFQLGLGKYWHFMPSNPDKSLEDNFNVLNENFAKHLQLGPNKTLCEIGCGLCRTGRDVARLHGATFLGVTLSPDEVKLGNEEAAALGLEQNESIILQGDYTAMPVVDGHCDSLLAVYTLKYSMPGGKLNAAFSEIARVLKPGGRFVSYEILTTEHFNETDAAQAGWVYNISYHTGMPPLANVRNYREDAQQRGLKLLVEDDLETRAGVLPTHQSFPFNMHMHQLGPICQAVDAIGLMPGLATYYEHFGLHPLLDVMESLRNGVVTASTIFAYERAAPGFTGASKQDA